MIRSFQWIAFSILLSASAYSANIAIIDSGVDYKHKDLANKIWVNPNTPVQTVTSDGTTYKEDLHGWNFAEKNNQIIDYRYLGTFSQDCYKIFHVQSKILQGTATAEEKTWYTAKKQDQQFLAELQKFGNFVHGTHVSGISTSTADKSHAIGMKLIPTAPPGGKTAEILEKAKQLGSTERATDPLIKMFLGMLAKQQSTLLTSIGKYTAATKAEIANGSFGTSVAAVKPVVEQLLKQFGKEATPEELNEYAVYLVEQIAANSKDFVGSAPTTLFVFAAGNDGTDNDKLPVSPANLKAENTLSVAATLGTQALAPFSNYGAKMVEVAAPGVAILSTIPGDQTLPMSGTSMAAPFVTNVAGLVKDTNTRLTAVDIKKVLMGTVDSKPFLQGKVVTGGIVNKERAIKAAELSLSMDLTSAIARARQIITDLPITSLRTPRSNELMVVPLPELLF